MSISDVMFSGWSRVRAAFDMGDHATLLEVLCDVYRMEAHMVAQCTQHADLMHYPQFRAELLRIAAEVQAHLPWLREQILALGGHLPASSPSPIREGNSWACLRHDVDEAQRGCERVLEWMHRVARDHPAIAVGLQHIRQDKLRHREELRGLFMKSDPYTVSPPGPPHAQADQQEQAWLAQRKSDWMDHERVAWAEDGKHTPWAEWAGEQEFKWATELPHRHCEWVHRLAAQRSAAPFSSRGEGADSTNLPSRGHARH